VDELQFNGLRFLHLLWAMPVLIVFYAVVFRHRRRLLETFADAGVLPRINVHASVSRQRCRAAMIVGAAVLIVVALTRPAWEAEPEKLRRRGRDVVFVVDVSRSMLATDIKPNRLELAKLAMLDALDVMEGDRVGLVAFAGTAVTKCPLTLDYGFFEKAVRELDAESVNRPGTKIGDAVRKVQKEVFKTKEKEFKDIVLITDGEDHDSFAVNAAEDAGKAGIRIIAIGLGDHEKGTRIPVRGERGGVAFLKDTSGNYVYSRLGWRTLQEMALASEGGRPYRVGPGETIDFASIYRKLIGGAKKTERETEIVKRYQERFQPFILAGLVLLCMEMVVSERRRT
jgi:Ca-activated chloride channel family protein